MLDKLFNKPDPKSKVTKDTDENTKVGVSSLRIIAKSTLLFKSVAKELKAINNAFGNYLKLSGIKPAVGEPVSATTKSLADSKEFKMAKVKVQVAGQGEKKQTFVTRIVDKLLNVLKLILLGAVFSVIVITEKIVAMLSSIVSNIFDAVVSGATAIINGIKNFFNTVDWLDLLTTGFNKYLNFISFGFICEEQTGKIMGDAGSAYRAILTGIGGFLKGVVEWIKPKLEAVGRFIGKDILGVDVDKVIEKRNERKRLVEESKKLEEESVNLDKITKELVTKRDKLKQEKEKKEKELDEKRNAEIKQKAEETYKKRSVFEKIFNRPSKEEEKKEEVKPTPPPIEERGKPAVAAPAPAAPPPPKAPAPAPAAPPPPKAPAPAAKPEPKLDVSKVPPSVKPVPPDIEPGTKTEKVASGGKFQNESDFVSTLAPWAQYVSKAIGGNVPTFAILGQWAGESGTGKSLPADYNYAGIKAGTKFQKGDFVLTEERYTDKQLESAKRKGEELERVLGQDDKMKKSGGRLVTVDEWFGKGTWQKTQDEGKNWVQVRSYFAKFRDLKDFSDSFAGFIMSPRYAKAREQKTAAGFGYEIAKAGYATASAEKYSAKVAAFDSKFSGSQIQSDSAQIGADQREQSKPKNPAYVNATTTNNTDIKTDTTIIQRKAA